MPNIQTTVSATFTEEEIKEAIGLYAQSHKPFKKADIRVELEITSDQHISATVTTLPAVEPQEVPMEPAEEPSL